MERNRVMDSLELAMDAPELPPALQPGRETPTPPVRSRPHAWWNAALTGALLAEIPDAPGVLVDPYCRMAHSATELLPHRPGLTYLGLDRDEARVAEATKEIAPFAIRARLRLGHPEQLPVESESIDVVLAVRALQTRPSVDPVLREAHRALRPGGRLIVVEPDGIGELFYFDGHLAAYNGAFNRLSAEIDHTMRTAAPGAPGLALGPLLADLLEGSGFKPGPLHARASTTLRRLSLIALVRRLRGYPMALAAAGGLGAEHPSVAAVMSAVDALEARLPADATGVGGNILPLFVCTGIKR